MAWFRELIFSCKPNLRFCEDRTTACPMIPRRLFANRWSNHSRARSNIWVTRCSIRTCSRADTAIWLDHRRLGSVAGNGSDTGEWASPPARREQCFAGTVRAAVSGSPHPAKLRTESLLRFSGLGSRGAAYLPRQ